MYNVLPSPPFSMLVSRIVLYVVHFRIQRGQFTLDFIIYISH